MEETQKLYAQLYDIDGLKDVSIFPLAIGWWAVIALAIFVMAYIAGIFVKRAKFKKSWRYRIIQQLNALEKNFNKAGKKQTISELSEIIKKAAIVEYSRREVAKLIGKKWLIWLHKKDSNNFDWVKKAQFLIDAPYLPEEKITTKKHEIFRVIDAAKRWVA
jgi:hypothetical protein